MSGGAREAAAAGASPALAARSAFELKYLVAEPVAAAIEAWARRELTPDPHGEAGRYRTTTLYLDTPELDVLRGSESMGGRKHRVRRYGGAAPDPATGARWFVERKVRRGDHVSKVRSEVAAGAIEEAAWFAAEVAAARLRPTARVTYDRTAFLAANADGGHRLTIDRALRGARCGERRLDPVEEGADLLGGQAIVELKFAGALPPCFRALLEAYRLSPSRVSKYRRFLGGALADGSAADGTRPGS